MVINLKAIDKTMLALVGGKAANLGELTRIDGINVPEGFCVTGDNDIEQITRLINEHTLYAVRSSATAEDLPTASFAGQHDTYLNIAGASEILKHIAKCRASLYTDRAIAYRKQNGFDDRKVKIAVVVQKMVSPQVSGIMFTADPVTSNRKITSIDASPGLGEALVSGLVNSDVYKVRDGKIEVERKATQALSDQQILRLEQIGRKIEAHFDKPQDIEWCLADGEFYIVQSRPITTLYPIPVAKDQENHVYLSVGHQQMMTDAMRPLGLSVRQLTSSSRHLFQTAGGRMFVDVTPQLSSPTQRNVIVNVLGKSDPLIKDAIVTILDRGDFIKTVPDNTEQGPPPLNYETKVEYDPNIVPGLIHRSEKSIDRLKHNIQTKSGTELLDFILDDIEELQKQIRDPQSFGVIMTSMNALTWLNDTMKKWLGDTNVADTIAQSAPDNITSEMGLALLDVADAIRPYPDAIDFLQGTKDDHFLDKVSKPVSDAINSFLDKYGMRCVGEIDITRTRWSEKPILLVPLILSNIKNFAPGESKRRFTKGLHEAAEKETELLSRLKQLPDGQQKAEETKRMIDLVRNYAGYREYPKYAIVSRYLIYKYALLKEAERFTKTPEDIYYLTFDELREAVRIQSLDYDLISERKEEYRHYEKLTPPRVITSDGEILNGKYNRRDIPVNAIAGLAVSSGVVEGRARVILNIADADLEEEDILVTAFTDPSWTPVFVSIKGLVTEVGGLMTHGAVIAREYGLPAVVGVENATKLIKDGQRILVNGTDGYVLIL